MRDMLILERAKSVLKIEADAVRSLIDKLDESFVKAIRLIDECRGKVVVMGIGKSGIICKKVASTFACTGTPAFFLHPSEAIHGDVGMLSKDDVIIAVSNSGETDEIVTLLPTIKRMGIPLIVMTGCLNSVLARSGDVVMDIGVGEEACPLGLVPTASSAASLAMGDALALALLEKRGFKSEDFAMLHPGGALGKKLLLRVEDLMHVQEEIPLVEQDTPMKFALLEMTSKRLGVTGVCDREGKFVGVITDGDLRRALEKKDDLLHKPASEVMTTSPKTIEKTALAAEALQCMEKYTITSLFILTDEHSRKVEGIIHMHDLLRAGVV
jgi:arabinose-5-phosphate isomerase